MVATYRKLFPPPLPPKLLPSSQFPDGVMITKLFPLLVANPLCVDVNGAPISYESYAFSPRQAREHRWSRRAESRACYSGGRALLRCSVVTRQNVVRGVLRPRFSGRSGYGRLREGSRSNTQHFCLTAKTERQILRRESACFSTIARTKNVDEAVQDIF